MKLYTRPVNPTPEHDSTNEKIPYEFHSVHVRVSPAAAPEEPSKQTQTNPAPDATASKQEEPVKTEKVLEITKDELVHAIAVAGGKMCSILEFNFLQALAEAMEISVLTNELCEALFGEGTLEHEEAAEE